MYTSNKFIIISISIILLISGCFGVQKPKDLNNQADLTVLNNFSVDVSQDIYNGKIDFGSKVSLILFADDFYKKTGLPFIGEKIGTTRLQESIKNKKKIAKAIAAYNLSLDGNNANEGSLLLQLKDKDPVVRSVTLIFLGKINREKYSGEIEKLYAKENKPFVKMYALRELFKFKPEKYYDTVLSHISDEDILNRTIAAGILLKEKPEIAEKGFV